MLTLALIIALTGFNTEHKRFVREERYDEAINIRHFCRFSGEFFFGQAVSYYKLKEYVLAKRSAEQALMDVNLPERYRVVLSLLMDEIENIKEKNDKLADISSDMNLVENRLKNGKAGPKTQELQRKIISKLDEQIKDIEDQMNKANSESQASKSNPTEGRKESGIIEEAPPKGELGNRKLVQGTENWGNLPKKDHIRVAESINRNLPPHIRESAENFSKRINSGNKP